MKQQLIKTSLARYFGLGLILFFLLLFSHLFLIKTIPGPIVFDESYYATQAQAILASGSDLYGQWRPWHLTVANPIYSELTGLAQSFGFIFITNSPILAMKILPAIFGALLPVLGGIFVLKITQNYRTAFLSTIIFAVNPWIFQFSRMGFDSFFGLFFIFFGLTMMVSLPKYWKLLSFVPLFFGFFQYQGYKIIFLPMIALAGIWVIFESCPLLIKERKNGLKVLLRQCGQNQNVIASSIVILLAGLLTGWFVFSLSSSSAGVRLQEFIWNDVVGITDQVNDQRRLSANSPVLQLASNKLTVTVNNVWLQTLSAFSPMNYFGKANAAIDTFAVHQHGFLYPIDALLLLIGFGVLWLTSNNKRSTAFLLTGLFLVSFLPSILKTDLTWITFRGGFTILFSLIIIAIGFEYLLRRFGKIIQILLVVVYLLFSLNFFYHYFFRYPAYATHNLMYSNRVLASYLHRVSNRASIVYDQPELLFSTILLLGNHINRHSISDISQSFQEKNYQWQNFTIDSSCISDQVFQTNQDITIIQAGTAECPSKNGLPTKVINYPASPIYLATPFDSGTVFRIYGDTLCHKEQINTFVNPVPPWQAIEDLSNEEFCQSFFVKDLRE